MGGREIFSSGEVRHGGFCHDVGVFRMLFRRILWRLVERKKLESMDVQDEMSVKKIGQTIM